MQSEPSPVVAESIGESIAPETQSRIAACEQLELAVARLSPDDLDALVHVADALANGVRLSGQLDVSSDRNFAANAPHGLRDGLVHLSTRLFC